ncbi:hypothetical protein BpHYR1_050338 [Brachionus plicatilis]|uniref:Uncharacterized protein n=1 Tax=Brachionus plicatilis TaxID=10195 RepID=A0A3M7PLT5_BRAPC|nr:hypothetical protein BpHYR1_050338 [Brachionus plicatilis]
MMNNRKFLLSSSVTIFKTMLEVLLSKIDFINKTVSSLVVLIPPDKIVIYIVELSIFFTLEVSEDKVSRPNRVTYFFDNFSKDSVTIENAKFNHPFSPKFLGHPVICWAILSLINDADNEIGALKGVPEVVGSDNSGERIC